MAGPDRAGSGGRPSRSPPRWVRVCSRSAAGAGGMSAKRWMVVAAAECLHCRSTVIDGEVIVQDENGHSDFEAIRYATANAPHRLIFFAFDAPFRNGEDLRDAPLEERRDLLPDQRA